MAHRNNRKTRMRTRKKSEVRGVRVRRHHFLRTRVGMFLIYPIHSVIHDVQAT